MGSSSTPRACRSRPLLLLSQPRARRPYRAKTRQGRTAVPLAIREDFFLGGTFRNLDDLNDQPAIGWISSPIRAFTLPICRIVNEAFAEKSPR